MSRCSVPPALHPVLWAPPASTRGIRASVVPNRQTASPRPRHEPPGVPKAAQGSAVPPAASRATGNADRSRSSIRNSDASTSLLRASRPFASVRPAICTVSGNQHPSSAQTANALSSRRCSSGRAAMARRNRAATSCTSLRNLSSRSPHAASARDQARAAACRRRPRSRWATAPRAPQTQAAHRDVFRGFHRRGRFGKSSPHRREKLLTSSE
jgi:hypothetical protein